MQKIVISGWAAVFGEDDKRITAQDVLRKLDGLHYDDEYATDYLGGTPVEDYLIEVLERSGTLLFRYVEESDLLRLTTEYISREPLNEEQLAGLTEYTAGQWSDGMGENFRLPFDCEWAKRDEG